MKNNKVLSNSEKGEVVWLYKSGESIEYIAYKLDTDVWNVQGILKQEGLLK